MFDYINSWYRRYFTDPQAALLAVILVLAIVVIYTMGRMLVPLFAAIIIAYLLEGAVQKLEQNRLPRLLSVNIVFLLFLAFVVFLLLGLFPIISRQLTQFFQEVPQMINNGQELLLKLPEQYPEYISEELIWEIIYAIRNGLSQLGHNVLSISVATIPAIITILVYLILVPLMIFFSSRTRNFSLNG